MSAIFPAKAIVDEEVNDHNSDTTGVHGITDTAELVTQAELDASGVTDKTYIFNQAIPEEVWTIPHNLSKYPSITVIDSANTTVEGSIQYNDENSATVTFNAAFSGKAICN